MEKQDKCPNEKCNNYQLVFDGYYWRAIDAGNWAVNYCGQCGTKLPYPEDNTCKKAD